MPDKGEERNKAQIKILNRTRMNTEKYKTKQRDAKTSCIKKKKPMTLRCWKVWRKQFEKMKQENSMQQLMEYRPVSSHEHLFVKRGIIT